MRKAADTPTTTRRALLGTAAAAPLAAIPLAAAAGEGDGSDAELLRRAGEFQRRQDRYLELTLPYLDVFDIPKEVSVELDALVPVVHKLAEQIANMRASTAAGLRAKARVLLAFSQHDAGGGPDWAGHDTLLGWSLARDLAGDEAALPPDKQARWRALAGEGAA